MLSCTRILLFAFASLFCCEPIHSHHKIIYLIAPPRSLSTVFMRSVYARGDIAVYNEPCEDAFLARYSSTESLIVRTYGQVKAELIQARRYRNVFVKDMPYAVYEAFYNDDMFLSDPQVEFCFLLRDPHAALISYHQVLQGETLSGFDWITDWLVYERHYALFKKIRKLRGEVPLVISSEHLTADPEKTMRHFCARMGIDFKQEMISWPSLKGVFNPLDWHDYTPLEVCQKWYANAIKSTHFTSCIRDYEVDSKGQPTFSELAAKDRGVVKAIHAHHMKFYGKMLTFSFS